ncbi:A1pp-domain-containing protein [Rhodofomes roseus]|uniref:A1pp-domain-containing protein n=1 Tax=Rhodofomes roseus TaxID=34475 RepID=A0ABQ8KK78_9APHY|nr:A1pp-domain-containing protein [Rhodofomes roseus]KAH9838333.1 A1pp-domain-containing protein [Rhodofomes roseus]
MSAGWAIFDSLFSSILSRIPTLRELYKASALGAIEQRYQPQDAYLDRVSLYQGDITKLDVDAIVNAANHSLLDNAVDGAIHAAAGFGLLDECRTLNGCETGNSKITKGYDLPAKHVIHTVGPIYSRSDSDTEETAQQLQSCYKTSLQIAVKNSLRHVAFPSVSTGIYGYPIVDATHIALDTVRQFLDSESGKILERVIFVVWSDKDKGVYEDLIPQYFPASEQE